MDLSLYRVTGALNRIALGDLAEGVEFFSAEKADDGTVTLVPVRVIDATTKRGTTGQAPATVVQTTVDDVLEPEDELWEDDDK